MSLSKSIRWSRLAELDLQSAYSYIKERNPEAAGRFAAEIHQIVERLHRHPLIGPIALDLFPRGRYRHVPWKRYRVIYRVDADLIWILRVWDSRRNPADLVPE